MNTITTPRHFKLIYVAAILIAALPSVTVMLGLLPYLFFALFSAVACVVLFRLYHPASAAVAPILSFLLMGALTGFSFSTLLLSFLPAAVGLSLAMGIRRGDNRFSLTISSAAVAVLILLAWVAFSLYTAAVKAGASDFLAYLTEMLDALWAELVALEMESFAAVAEIFEARGLEYVAPTEGELTAMIGQVMALAPAVLLVVSLVVSLALTYGVQLVALLLEDKRLFDRRHTLYEPDFLIAAVYLFVTLVTLVHVDFSSPFYLVCINTAWVLSPLLAFVAILKIPRLFSFMRRMSRGGFDFALWVVLLILCALSYLSLIFTVLAVWQAIHILVSAFVTRKKNGAA